MVCFSVGKRDDVHLVFISWIALNKRDFARRGDKKLPAQIRQVVTVYIDAGHRWSNSDFTALWWREAENKPQFSF